MKALLPLLIVALGAPVALAAADASGHWEGAVKVGAGPTRVSLDLARNDHGDWSASLGVPEKNASGLVVADLKVNGNRVTFRSPDMPNEPVFDLTLREGKLVGTMALKGSPLPLEMTRTGDAKVEIIPPSPAVSSQLEGDWEGGLFLPNGDSRPLRFHFRNLPDHTVSATLDSPTQQAFNLGLAGVIQNGSEVEFYVRIHGGSFKGTLNAEGNQLHGEWFQGAGATPIPCQMRKP